MRARLAALAALVLVLAGCKPAEESRTKAIVGAVLLDGTGRPPVSNSVVVVAGSRIRAVGPSSATPIPADSEKVNGAGKFVAPAPINIYPELSGANARVVLVAAGASETVLDEARRNNRHAIAEISTVAEAKHYVDAGISGFVGMMHDTTALDFEFVARLRNLQLVFAPMLTKLPPGSPELSIASVNTRQLARSGVPIALAALEGQVDREMELLVEAGLPPADVLAAATRNSALALQRLDQAGTIEPGKSADLLLLAANPAEDIRNLRRIERALKAGEWVLKKAGLK